MKSILNFLVLFKWSTSFKIKISGSASDPNPVDTVTLSKQYKTVKVTISNSSHISYRKDAEWESYGTETGQLTNGMTLDISDYTLFSFMVPTDAMPATLTFTS